MLAKCIQVSVKVSVTEGSLKGKVFGVGGKPQQQGQIMCRESLCPCTAWTVRKITGLFPIQMSSPARSGQMPLHKHRIGQFGLFLLLLNCLQKGSVREECLSVCPSLPVHPSRCSHTPGTGGQRDSTTHGPSSPNYGGRHRLGTWFLIPLLSV